ncbi:MAG: glycoside hydrolase family 3 N-terminal domain-containing protein, partial [Bacteroidota bacterium]
MKMKKNLSLFILTLIILGGCGQVEKNGKQATGSLPGADTLAFLNTSLSIDERVADLVSRLTLEEKVQQMMHEAPGIERLGIDPYNWWNECLHGVARSGRATVFPQAIGMAAAFDEDLMHRIGTAISDEGRALYHAAVGKGHFLRYGGLTFWTPNINIFRDPRWGRGQETYGEDPFLTSRLGVNFVKGLQGDNPDYMKAAACAKHYVVHS